VTWLQPLKVLVSDLATTIEGLRDASENAREIESRVNEQLAAEAASE